MKIELREPTWDEFMLYLKEYESLDKNTNNYNEDRAWISCIAIVVILTIGHLIWNTITVSRINNIDTKIEKLEKKTDFRSLSNTPTNDYLYDRIIIPLYESP